MIYIIVPYRNRKDQLEIFTKYTKYLFDIFKIEVKIIICHQNDEKLFNKGLLINKGLAFLIKNNKISLEDTIIINDIDSLCPEDNFHNLIKNPLNNIRHIFGYNKLFWDKFYCLGGVITLKLKTFTAINGFPNNFEGWGAEDLNLALRAKIKNIHIDNTDLKIVNHNDYYQLCNPIHELSKEERLKNNDKNFLILLKSYINNSLIKNNGIDNLLKENYLSNIFYFRDYTMISFYN